MCPTTYFKNHSHECACLLAYVIVCLCACSACVSTIKALCCDRYCLLGNYHRALIDETTIFVIFDDSSWLIKTRYITSYTYVCMHV